MMKAGRLAGRRAGGRAGGQAGRQARLAIVWGSDFPFGFSGFTSENEGWVECMNLRGCKIIMISIVIMIIIIPKS